MHSQIYNAGIAFACLLAWQQAGPGATSSLILAGIAIAVIGVPHGGLDHWTGRRWLQPYYSQRWPLIFFSGYAALVVFTAIAWVASPVLAALAFFLISAWHFGREDQQVDATPSAAGQPSQGRSWGRLLRQHVAAIATGGLVIWAPAIARPEEMRRTLEALLGTSSGAAAESIVQLTGMLSCVLLPLGTLLAVIAVRGEQRAVGTAQLFTILLCITTPILWSFTIYFCGWHSLRGLRRLRHEEGLGAFAFARAILPLSLGGLVAMTAIGVMGGAHAGLTLSADLLSAEAGRETLLRILFIGLSAIAIPHLLLHEFASARAKAAGSESLLLIGADA